MAPQTIAVIGATGNQGGSVARSLVQNSAFSVRAITRNAGSTASQALVADCSGAATIEVVQADGFHGQEMAAALQGATGLYLNINSDDKMWAQSDVPTEYDLGRSILDAAASAGVRHIVFSSGPPCVEMTGGEVNMKAMQSACCGAIHCLLLPMAFIPSPFPMPRPSSFCPLSQEPSSLKHVIVKNH
jgi:nucleoside-diphosphate-sugar epimerase